MVYEVHIGASDSIEVRVENMFQVFADGMLATRSSSTFTPKQQWRSPNDTSRRIAKSGQVEAVSPSLERRARGRSRGVVSFTRRLHMST